MLWRVGEEWCAAQIWTVGDSVFSITPKQWVKCVKIKKKIWIWSEAVSSSCFCFCDNKQFGSVWQLKQTNSPNSPGSLIFLQKRLSLLPHLFINSVMQIWARTKEAKYKILKMKHFQSPLSSEFLSAHCLRFPASYVKWQSSKNQL